MLRPGTGRRTVVRVTPRGQDERKVYRITGAPRSHTEDINRRINRYLVSMTVRTVCVVLIFVLDGPGRWVAAAGAIFLPWVAVMMANASDRRVSVALPPMALDHKALTTGAEPTGPEPTVLDGEVISPDRPRGHRGADLGGPDLRGARPGPSRPGACRGA